MLHKRYLLHHEHYLGWQIIYSAVHLDSIGLVPEPIRSSVDAGVQRQDFTFSWEDHFPASASQPRGSKGTAPEQPGRACFVIDQGACPLGLLCQKKPCKTCAKKKDDNRNKKRGQKLLAKKDKAHTQQQQHNGQSNIPPSPRNPTPVQNT
jgi:hypothetical protein